MNAPPSLQPREGDAAESGLRTIPPAPATARMLDAPLVPRGEIDWMGDAWRATLREVRLYLATAWAFSVRPREAGAAYARGELRPLNPFAFLLNTLAVLGPWRALCQWAMGLPELPLWMTLNYVVTPFLSVLVIGGVHHVFFRWAGSKRRLQSTVAVSVYAIGGLPTLIDALTTPMTVKMMSLAATAAADPNIVHHPVLVAGRVLSFGLVVLMLVMSNLALSGLHGMRRRRTAAIQVVSTTVIVVGLALLTAVVTVGSILAIRWGRHFVH